MADLKLGVDSSGAQKGFNDATKSADSFTASIKRAVQATRDFASGFKQGVADEFRAQMQSHTQAAGQFQKQIKDADASTKTFADTLTRRFVTGYIITQLRQVAKQLQDINAEIARTGDLANRTGVGGSALQGLLGAAGNKGIEPTQFLDAFSKVNEQLDLAKRGAGDLLTLFRQNNIPLGDTQDTFLKIADLVSNATSELAKQNILRAAGLPDSIAFVRLMEQGADAIRKQADAVPKLTQAQIDAAAKLDKDFNEAFTNITQYGKSAFVAIAQVFHDAFGQDLEDIRKIVSLFEKIKSFAPGYNAALTGATGALNESAGLNTGKTVGQIVGRTKSFLFQQSGNDLATPLNKPSIDPEQLRLANQQLVQRISLLGDLATVDQQVSVKEAELNLAALNNINLSARQREAILAETRLKAEATQASAKLQYGLATEKDIRTQILASIPPAQRAIAEQTEAYKKQTEQLRINNEVAAAALPGLKQLELQSKDVRTQLDTLGQGLTSGITNPLVDLASGATKAGDAFKQMGLNVIRAIEQMIVNMTIAAPIARGLQSILGGFLPGAGIGWAGQPTQLGDATLVSNAVGGVFSGPGISSYSSTIVDKPTIFPFAKGIGLMGEAGAEAIMPLTRIGGKLGVRAEGGSGGDTYIDMSGMQIALPQDPNGNDPSGTIRSAAVARAMESSVRNIVKDEMIRAQKPRGALNRASAI